MIIFPSLRADNVINDSSNKPVHLVSLLIAHDLISRMIEHVWTKCAKKWYQAFWFVTTNDKPDFTLESVNCYIWDFKLKPFQLVCRI